MKKNGKIMEFFKSKSLKKFFRYSLKYRYSMMALLIFTTITSLMSAVPAWLSKYLIDDVLSENNKIPTEKKVKMMGLVVSGIVITTIIKVLANYLAEIKSVYLSEKVKRDIKIDVFTHLQSLPISFYKKNKLGDIMTRLSADSATVGRIGFIIFELLKEAIIIVALLARMFQVDMVLAIASITVLPAILGTVRKYTKKIKKSGRERQNTIGNINSFVQEMLSGVMVIKGFNKSQKVIDEYKEKTENELRKIYATSKIVAKVSPINEILATFMVALVAGYGGYQILIAKAITSGDLVSFITAIGLMQQPLKVWLKKNAELQDILPSADRVIEILDVSVEAEYIGEPKECVEKVDEISFKNVDFKYDDSEEMTLKNFNLEVKSGEVVAFVGKSGSGKTTLVNLIPRYYNVTSGAIEINGIDIREMKLSEYRNHIGIVPQETFLFSGTIMENIAFAKENATESEIIEAAKMANAYNFIMELPNKFETDIGERGVLLSGGQKQRIAIARALLQNPSIMILDEATSALDTESERLVQEALDRLMVGRTTFVIAHRLSTIINADKIVVMEKGEIKEVGTHKQLLENEGIYRKLYEIQFGEIEKEIKVKRK